MKRSENFLPRKKSDFKRLNKLKRLDRTELIPLLLHLIEWLQDINWPIAPEVADLLLTLPREIVPHVKTVLESDDDIWKYWCLEYLVKKLPLDEKKLFKNDLISLTESPTLEEKLEELDELAGEILRTMEH